MLRWHDLRLRTRLAALLVAASVLPLALSAFIGIWHARAELLDSTKSQLRSGAEQIARELDEFHRGRLRAAERIARFPEAMAFCEADAARRTAALAALVQLLSVFPAGDPSISGAALLDRAGRVVAATNPAVMGADLSFRPYVQTALRGTTTLSDIYLTVAQGGEAPAIAYAAPMRGPDGQVVCISLLLVRAGAIWQRIRTSDGLVGPGSYAVLFDSQGIRIAHSFSDDIVFHPGGRLEPAAVDQLVAERRFGARTRALLEDVRVFPEQFERARAPAPDPEIFLGLASASQAMTYGVARRFETVPWTLFYMVPESNVQAQIARQTRSQVALALAIIAAASALGLLFARSIVRPLAALGRATSAIAAGDLGARVQVPGRGELGSLAGSFNTMAERIQEQSSALQRSRDELEQRVTGRTAELARSTEQLRTEVVERRRAEAAIRESQALLQAIIDNTAAVIYVKDLQGRYLLVNRRYLELFRLDNADVIGRSDDDLLPAETAAAVRATDRRVAAADAPVIAEETVPLDDGPHVYLSVKCPLRDAGDHRVRGVFGISTDITERKEAEQRLQDQIERLNLLDQITSAIGERQDLQSIYQVAIRSLEERLPVDFICLCRYDPADEQLTVTRVGVRSEALALALAMPENAGVPIDENGLSRCVRGHLVYEPELAQVPFPFPQRLLRGELHSLVAAPLQSESRVFGVLIAARRRPHAFNSGECEFLRQLGAHVALAAKQAELHASLQRAYDDLRRTQQSVMQQERLRALGEMASGIAHDINNAISPITLYTENLLEREPALSERGREQLQTIAMAIDDVAATVARLREFYRQREPQAALLPVHLNEIVRNVVELTRARWHDMPQQRGVVISLDVDLADGLPAVLGAEPELREALINLVFNAVDAMPGGGTLTLRTRAPASAGQPVLLEAADNGVGMDEATRRRCLEPFFTTKGERGTGLGLAMVYGVVQRHGADIEIESAPGHGTTIRIGLPATGSTAPTPAAPPPMAVPAAPLRLLVVDDDPIMLKTLGETLAQEGHAVTVASGGQAAIDAVFAAQRAGRAFDAVITDLGMPYVDGRRVAAAVKQADATMPVIMLTGWGQRLAADGEIPAHVDQMLAKPPKLQALRAALAHVTRRRPEEPA
ncbi:MAG: PAS domain-containing protein [Burkholderiales bacterium]|nr:PAS domain-containing protein [Burkholderiales bacterium]